VLLALFLTQKPALAAFPSQTEIGSSFGHSATQTQMWIQTFGTGLSGSASLINLYGARSGDIKNVKVFLVESPTSNNSILDTTGFNCSSPPTGGAFVASTTIISADWPTTAGIFTKYFNTPYSLNASKYYGLCLMNDTTSGQQVGSWNLYGANNNVFSAGALWRNPYDYYPDWPQYGTAPTYWGIYDLYFLFTPFITNSVSINNIASSTEPAISFQWPYQLDSATTSLGYYTIFPEWDLYKCDPSCFTKIGSNFGYNSIPNNNIATGTTAGFSLDNGNYQIQNFYLKYDSVGAGNITASTTPVDSNIFFINFETGYIPIISFPTSTASSTEWVFTCDPESGFFSNSMCNLAQWLFIPSQSVLNQFSNLTADISTKPPIGYFVSIKNSLSGLTSSTPAFTIDVDSANPVATTFFTPIRTGLIWILWLFFAFWVFHRFRHFNFTSP
jgi:hypothetical protein